MISGFISCCSLHLIMRRDSRFLPRELYSRLVERLTSRAVGWTYEDDVGTSQHHQTQSPRFHTFVYTSGGDETRESIDSLSYSSTTSSMTRFINWSKPFRVPVTAPQPHRHYEYGTLTFSSTHKLDAYALIDILLQVEYRFTLLLFSWTSITGSSTTSTS